MRVSIFNVKTEQAWNIYVEDAARQSKRIVQWFPPLFAIPLGLVLFFGALGLGLIILGAIIPTKFLMEKP